jgi:hypothetical protein
MTEAILGVIVSFAMFQFQPIETVPKQNLPMPDNRSCEIHLWIDPVYTAKTFSIFPNFDQTFKEKNKSDKEFLESAISSDIISEISRSEKLYTHKSVDYIISFKQGSFDIKSLRKERIQNNNNYGRCILELYLTDVVYAKDGVWGGAVGFTAQRRKLIAGEGKPSFRKIFGAANVDMKPSAYMDEEKLVNDLREAAKLAFNELIKEAVE